ncbi:MAG: cytochrome c oxidase assembly protein [Solirubrobacteraceae bacterium]
MGLALGLHIAGERRAARIRRRPRDRRARLRSSAFYAGLLVIVISLKGPIDNDAAQLFWVHMIQHVLLLTVAAPLIVLGAPWNSLWRPLPLEFRRDVAGGLAHARWAAPLRAVGRALGSPTGAWLAFSINLIAWHIPVMFDLTLQHLWIHACEHTTFLVFGILLWSQVIESPPLRLKLRLDQRAYYIVGASAVGWALSLVLAFATRPLYPVYAHLAYRPSGISALTDQQLAAGVMLVPGSLTMTIFVFVGLYRWLGKETDADVPQRRPTAGGART